MPSLICKSVIIIGKSPIMQTGLGSIMSRYFPDYDRSYCRTHEELTLLQLRRAGVVIVDISDEQRNSRNICNQYHVLQNQYRDIHWIFLVSRAIYPLSVEHLMRPESTLLSNMEPIESVVKAIRAGSENAERISQTLLIPDPDDLYDNQDEVMLTFSERKVLRLLGKGWGINQIAALLKKSNKTVSAQKNSAMRRLALTSNAEMYAWINSTKGMKELSLFSAYGEQDEWKRARQKDISLSSKSA
ncbi:response regulator transcription factor [Leclercia sp. EC_58]|uniref:response regulator transcription factor n=1 Tax=Leclercia sp. EC_58 TaxID=2584090 RepID=UPI001C7087B6|nr:response regulator transcription factor [Leclercia sp. EC_58]MBW9399835.1 response regulator transcription factor [Leclercia sp. EC_58]